MIAVIYELSIWVNETTPKKLLKIVDSSLIKSGHSVFKYSEKHFTPMGYTGLWLLGESHAAVHTYPEDQCTYIQLSSCNLELYKTFRRLILAQPNWRYISIVENVSKPQ